MRNMNAARLTVQPLDVQFSLKDKAYEALRQAIMDMDIYGQREELRLDERQLSEDLGVSRTPIREALGRLELEGFVRIEPRRGAFVVRKTKREVLEMITVWSALEGTAARLITLHASDEDIATLRGLFATFTTGGPRAHIDEYSETNIRFHQRILQLSQNALIVQMADNLLAHMRSIRRQTIGEQDRAERSIIDHMHIIEALEKRQTDLAEQLSRQHTMALAEHVEKHVHYLD